MKTYYVTDDHNVFVRRPDIKWLVWHQPRPGGLLRLAQRWTRDIP